MTDGVGSVAAAALDHTGRAVASIGVTSRPAPDDDVATAVVATAARLTSRLGGHRS